MKRLIVLAMILVFCLVGSVQAAETVYRGFPMKEYDLELMQKILIVKGYKGFTPIQGTSYFNMKSDNGPMHYSVICGKAKGGIVRVKITLIDHEFNVEVLK